MKSTDFDATTNASPELSAHQLLSATDLAAYLKVSRATLFRYLQEGQIPPPIRLSDRVTRWSSETIIEWQRAMASKELKRASG